MGASSSKGRTLSTGVAMAYTHAHGKICYVELPSNDAKQSAEFYAKVFGWKSRTRSDGHLAFDDAIGEVSGSWVTGRKPAAEPGLIFYVMVDDLAAAVRTAADAGAEIVRPYDPAQSEKYAWVRDPGGNVIGIYQEP
jgi:uncharacterized protein